MNYSEACKLISRLERFGIKLGLERIKKLLSNLGRPQRKLKIIHIAGTNGKGSTAAMLAHILQAAGFRVGLFTSPHLFDWRERLTVFETKGRAVISKRDFSSGLTKLKPYINQLKREKNDPTGFEVLTALSLDYFAKKRLDFAVMETGLGGRLDATNIISPLISVITNIELEHREHLGSTREKIAQEKAGIIKKGCLVVTAENRPRLLKILKERCKKKSAKLLQVGKDIKLLSYELKKSEGNLSGCISVKGKRSFYSNLELSLLGKHQAVNAVTAVGTAESLGSFGIKISSEAIRKGLKRTYWPGRLEIISKKPMIMLDGAHNPAAAEAIAKTLKEIKGCYKELFLVFGCLKGKDIDGILAALLPLCSHIIAVTVQNNRSLAAGIIAGKVVKFGKPCLVIKNGKKAVKYAFKKARSIDLILITGSLYLTGEIKRGNLKI